jgi:hypothetical protein
MLGTKRAPYAAAIPRGIERDPDSGRWLKGPSIEVSPPIFDQGKARVAALDAERRRSERLLVALAVFKHALVEDVADASLLRANRQQIHARIAKAYETSFSDADCRQLSRRHQHAACPSRLGSAVRRVDQQGHGEPCVAQSVSRLRARFHAQARTGLIRWRRRSSPSFFHPNTNRRM